MGVTLVDL